MNLARTAAVVLFTVAAGACLAKPPFLRIFLATYKVDPNSELGRARCLTCHMPPGPPVRNPFGKDVQAALRATHARMISPELLRSIEQKDSDGDGFSNIAEIKAGTLPGNAQSKPHPAKPKKTHPKPKKHKKKKLAMLGISDSSGAALLLLPGALVGGLLVRRSSREMAGNAETSEPC